MQRTGTQAQCIVIDGAPNPYSSVKVQEVPLGCHSERSEESASGQREILRCAQNDSRHGSLRVDRVLKLDVLCDGEGSAPYLQCQAVSRGFYKFAAQCGQLH